MAPAQHLQLSSRRCRRRRDPQRLESHPEGPRLALHDGEVPHHVGLTPPGRRCGNGSRNWCDRSGERLRLSCLPHHYSNAEESRENGNRDDQHYPVDPPVPVAHGRLNGLRPTTGPLTY